MILMTFSILLVLASAMGEGEKKPTCNAFNLSKTVVTPPTGRGMGTGGTSALLDSRGENGRSFGAIFCQP